MGIEGEMLRPMNADHSSICKFKDADDPLYDSVLSVLKEMIGDAGRFLESRSTFLFVDSTTSISLQCNTIFMRSCLVSS